MKRSFLTLCATVLMIVIVTYNILNAFKSDDKVSGAILYKKVPSVEEYKTSDGWGVKVSRQIVYVPEEYGAVISVIQDGRYTVLWFSGNDQTLRNVVVEGSCSNLYEIKILK